MSSAVPLARVQDTALCTVQDDMCSAVELELLQQLQEEAGGSNHIVQLFNRVYKRNKCYFRVVAAAGGPVPFVENNCSFVQKTEDSNVKLAVPFVVCRDNGCKCKMFHVCSHWPSKIGNCKNCRCDPSKNPDNFAVYAAYPLLHKLSAALLKHLIKFSKFVIRPETPILFEKCSSDMLSFPRVCEYYNSEAGCLGIPCLFFHLCRKYIQGTCPRDSNTCSHSHDFTSTHNRKIVEICTGIPMDASSIIRVMNCQTSVTALALDILHNDTMIHNNDTELICVWNLVGKCEKGSLCPSHHVNLPFWWQFETEDEGWESWDTDSILILEKAFCNPVIRTVEIKVKAMIVIIDFQTMTIVEGLYRVRRLSTGPVHGARYLGSLATSYQWHWEQADNVWHEFPSCVTQGKHVPQLELPSHVIELAFLSGSEKLQFKISDSTFVLLFGGMQMKEEGCSNARKICRRPLHRTVPWCAGIITGKENADHEYYTSVKEADEEDWKFVQSLLKSDEHPTQIKSISSNIIDKQFSKRSKGKKTRYLFYPAVGNEKQVDSGGDEIVALAQHGILLTDTPDHMKQYGTGIHLSTDETHSLHFTKTRSVVVVEAVIGEYCRGKVTDTAPPLSQYGKQVDCCVNNVIDPTVFVFYDIGCVRPKYWITF